VLGTLLTIGGPILVELLKAQSSKNQNAMVTDMAKQVSAGMSSIRMIKRDLTSLTEPATLEALEEMENQARAMVAETDALKAKWGAIIDRRKSGG